MALADRGSEVIYIAPAVIPDTNATLADLRYKTVFGENMKLIMRSEFESLRLNDLNEYDADKSGDTKIVRIYRDGNLIAKKKNHKKSVRYFGAPGYEKYLSESS